MLADQREGDSIGHCGCGAGLSRGALRLDNGLLRQNNFLRHSRLRTTQACRLIQASEATSNNLLTPWQPYRAKISLRDTAALLVYLLCVFWTFPSRNIAGPEPSRSIQVKRLG
jgi:hypothetical protein